MKFILITTIMLFTFLGSAQQVVVDSIPYQDSYRKVRLFLPDNYKTQTFPLLIMMDGQNLFDKETSYAGEWFVDETISSFPVKKQAIVIAIDHGNNLRMEELTPYTNEKYGGGKAADFLEWIMINVLPETINKHKLQINKHKVAIAGSSLGALFAHYAAITHPQYFQTAGLFSPSFWWSDECYELVNDLNEIKNQDYFFSAGTKEGDDMIPDLEKMHDLMLKKGARVSLLIEKGASHNEKQWKGTFPAFYYNWITSI